MNRLGWTLDQWPPDALSDIRAQVAHLLHHLGDTADLDTAWAVTRVAAAIGHPAARLPPDPAEVFDALEAVLRVETVKTTRYYRIGEPLGGTRYVVVAVWPGQEDLALLVAAPPAGMTYTFDPSVPEVRLNGRRVPWPLFEPPPVRLLASTSIADMNQSGFVPEALAVGGNAQLPAPTTSNLRS